MSINLEVRKLAIIERLAEMEDENIILQIENLIQPRIDIWDELNAAEKALINKGVEDLEQDRRIPFEDVLTEYRKPK